MRASLPMIACACALAVLLLHGCSGSSSKDPDPTPSRIALSVIGGFTHAGGEGAAEIPAYDPASRRLFMVNGALATVDVLDLAHPAQPTQVGTIDVSAFGGGVNSVAVSRGVVALAVEASDAQSPGMVVLYRASDLLQLGAARVGALPDMVVFTPDGKTVLVANEGEPNDDFTIDPEGSVSVVDVSDPAAPTVRTAGFAAFNGQLDALRAHGVRILRPGASVAMDLEPEYISVSGDGTTAWVTLQENNAVAVLDIASATITEILPLGFRDHRLPNNGLDVSDRAGAIDLRSWPIFGMCPPDAIARFTSGGETYPVTANEGDARDDDGFSEENWVSGITLDPVAFADAACGGAVRCKLRVTPTQP